MNYNYLLVLLTVFIAWNTGYSHPVIEMSNTTKCNTTNDTCEVCVLVTNYIYKEAVLGNKTFTDLIQLVEDLCKIIGGPIVSKECNFILEHLKDIISWLTNGLKPCQVCEKLGLCDSEMLQKIFTKVNE